MVLTKNEVRLREAFRLNRTNWLVLHVLLDYKDGLVKYVRQIISYTMTQILDKIKPDGLLSIYPSNIKVLPTIHIKAFPILLLPDVLCDYRMGFMKFFQEYDKSSIN